MNVVDITEYQFGLWIERNVLRSLASCHVEGSGDVPSTIQNVKLVSTAIRIPDEIKLVNVMKYLLRETEMRFVLYNQLHTGA